MPFFHQVEVLPADVDRLGHASNQVYLRWVLDAALAHSTALGLGEEDYLARGQAWVAGDRLRVETRVESMSAASSVRRTRVLRPADGAVLLEALTDWVYVEIARGKPARIPPDVRERFPLEP